MRILPTIALAALLAGCGGQGGPAAEASSTPRAAADAAGGAAPAPSAVARTFGQGVTEGPIVAVSALLAAPGDHVGRTVRVEGLAVAVCGHRGCWFDIASDAEGEVLRFKVPDGVMVFPPEMVGERVRAEGVFTATELDLQTTRRICAAEATEAGESFDPESITECRTLYQISGTGAQWLELP